MIKIMTNINKTYIAYAFTGENKKGNPAGVCVLSNYLNDEIMQKTAENNNLPVTAFLVFDGKEKRYNIRWFTCNKEIFLCVHATIASAIFLFSQNNDLKEIKFFAIKVQEGLDKEFLVKKSEGADRTGIKKDGISLDFPAIALVKNDIRLHKGDLENIAKVLFSIPKEQELPEEKKPVETALGENGYRIIRFKDGTDTKTLNPDFNKLAEFDKKWQFNYGTMFIATAKQGVKGADINSRYFAPSWNINEDIVCGSANCTLATFWQEEFKNQEQLISVSRSKEGGDLLMSLKNIDKGRVLLNARGSY